MILEGQNQPQDFILFLSLIAPYPLSPIPDLFEVAIEPVLEFFHSGELTFSKKDISEILRLLLYFDANIDKNDYKEIAKLAKVKLFYSNEKGFLTKEEKEGKVYEKSMAQAKLAKDNLMLKVYFGDRVCISDVPRDLRQVFACPSSITCLFYTPRTSLHLRRSRRMGLHERLRSQKTNHRQKETHRTQNSQP